MIILLLVVILADESAVFEIEEARDLEIIIKDIEYLKNNPVDINTANFEELSRIPYLSIADCLRILDYRREKGPFGSLQDLLNIPGFDVLLLEKIRPFITVKMKPLKIEKFATRVRLRSEIPKKQFSEEYYTKTEFSAEQYNICFVSEKDPYENSVFDYYAAGILIDEGFRRFALGKYNLDLGSGVVLSPLGSFFHTMDFRMMTAERGIIPYTSVLENSGFFGAALSDSLFFKFAIFYSNQKLDGRIDSAGFTGSLDESGEHTDSLSLSRKDRISEEIMGYDIKYRFEDLLVSNRTYWCSYEPGFACGDSFAKFYGDRFLVSGLELKYFTDFFILFSEFARSHKNRLGGLFGFGGYFPYIDFNLAGKYFPVGFYSPKGIEAQDDYIGGVINISSRTKIINFVTTLTIDNKAEEDSAKYGLKVNFEKKIGILNAKFQIRWRYAAQIKDLSGSRVFLRIKPVRDIFLDLRLEDKYVYSPDGVEKGIFGALELASEFKKLQLRIRYGLFNTDSYATRIFVYEVDLPGIINNRMLYNRGNCGFIYLSVMPADKFKIGFKYSHVNKDTLTVKQFGTQLDVRL